MKFIKISLALVFLLLISCKGEGIFYTLRDEIPIQNSRFPDDARLVNIFTITDGSSIVHTIATGAVMWERTENTSWNILPYPPSFEKNDTYITSCVKYNGNIYTVFRNSDKSYIYYYDLDSETWTNASSSLPDLNDNYYLFSDPENDSWLYINQREYAGESKFLYFFNTAMLDFSEPVQVSIESSTDVSIPVISVDYDGSNYRLLSNITLQDGNSNLYVSSDGINFNIDATVNADQFQEVESISTAEGNLLLLGKKVGTGLEYQTPNGDWKDLGVGNLDGDFALYNFTDLNPDNNDNLLDLVIVGIYNITNMNDQGYILMDYSDSENLTLSATNIADRNNYNSSELPNSAVNGIVQIFYNDLDQTEGYKLYAASNNGLWSYDSLTSLWKQE